MITVSSQRPNLQPTLSSTPMVRKPARWCAAIDASWAEIANDRHHLTHTASGRPGDQRLEQRVADAAPARPAAT